MWFPFLNKNNDITPLHNIASLDLIFNAIFEREKAVVGKD